MSMSWFEACFDMLHQPRGGAVKVTFAPVPAGQTLASDAVLTCDVTAPFEMQPKRL
jgi:hypothetical protein